jgi:hypothetical protein
MARALSEEGNPVSIRSIAARLGCNANDVRHTAQNAFGLLSEIDLLNERSQKANGCRRFRPEIDGVVLPWLLLRLTLPASERTLKFPLY